MPNIGDEVTYEIVVKSVPVMSLGRSLMTHVWGWWRLSNYKWDREFVGSRSVPEDLTSVYVRFQYRIRMTFTYLDPYMGWTVESQYVGGKLEQFDIRAYPRAKLLDRLKLLWLFLWSKRVRNA